MAEDKLQEAIENQAKSLDPAQREFVMAQFATYQWNAGQIAILEKQLEEGVADADGYRNYQAENQLFKQRHQMVAEQSVLFSHIMRWLKGTAVGDNELDEFI